MGKPRIQSAAWLNRLQRVVPISKLSLNMECSLPNDSDEQVKRGKKTRADNKGPNPDAEYLNCLKENENQAIDLFDKTILALVSGAFAVSFAFLKDIVKPEVVGHKGWIILAWTCWCVTLTCNLSSFYCSHLAMRNAQRKFREGIRDEKLLSGRFGTAVEWLNPSAGVVFMIGLISMAVFVTKNLNYEPAAKSRSSTSTNAPAAAAASAPAAAAASASATFPTNAAAPTNTASP
jgi:hypothetical protein